MWRVLHVFVDLVCDCSICLMWIVLYVNIFVCVDFIFRFLGCSPNVRGLLLLHVAVYDYVCASYIYVFCLAYFFRAFDSEYICALYMYVICICVCCLCGVFSFYLWMSCFLEFSYMIVYVLYICFSCIFFQTF